jgi:hypothetical protein
MLTNSAAFGALLLAVLTGSLSAQGAAPAPRPQLEPPCAAPAPIVNSPDPAHIVPDRYIVSLRDGTNAAREARRLARKYGFQPRHLYTQPPVGFSARLSRRTLARIRCEPSVTGVEYVGRGVVRLRHN